MQLGRHVAVTCSGCHAVVYAIAGLLCSQDEGLFTAIKLGCHAAVTCSGCHAVVYAIAGLLCS